MFFFLGNFEKQKKESSWALLQNLIVQFSHVI